MTERPTHPAIPFDTRSSPWASALAAAAGLFLAVLAVSSVSAQVEGAAGEEPEAAATGEEPTAHSISGVFLRMAALAEHALRSEAGIGALMPWADRLWLITYVSHKAATSDPYLMTGFDEKVLHLWHEADEPVTFTVEVDPLGSGIWQPYERITVDPGEYVHHGFPDAFSAHWVCLRTDRCGVVTAQFVYH